MVTSAASPVTRPAELVHSLLDDAATVTPDAPAVRDATVRWSYAELVDRSRSLAAWLRSCGVGRGDRVVVQMATGAEQAALFFATSRLGAAFVPLNPAMKPFQLTAVILDAEPVLVVGDRASAPGLRQASDRPVHDIASAPAGDDATAVRLEPPTESTSTDIAAIIYTSGSTALPKGVIEPHAQIVFACRSLQQVLRYRDDDVVFCRFPLSWDVGLYKVLLSVLGGAEIVFADQESDLVLLDRIAEVGTTVLPIVPSLATMITTLAQRRPEFSAPVRLISNTGAALSPRLIERLREVFPAAVVVRQFGQTECKRLTVMPLAEERERPGALGLPLPGTEVKIISAEGQVLPPHEVGEIVARGPHVMPGYWRNPEQTARTFVTDPDGTPTLRTGDYGWMDEDGYLYFQGRRDDMFKRKGIRVSTLEIEHAALDIPGVISAGVVPPSESSDLGLCVVTHLEEVEVLRQLAARLEPAKVPAICRRIPEMPLTHNGKTAIDQLRRVLAGVA